MGKHALLNASKQTFISITVGCEVYIAPARLYMESQSEFFPIFDIAFVSFFLTFYETEIHIVPMDESAQYIRFPLWRFLLAMNGKIINGGLRTPSSK